MAMLRRFLAAAGCRPDLDHARRHRGADRARSGRRSASAHAICGLSGGVDSAVAAALVQRAIGPRLTCVFVDHGLLRTGEAEQVEQDFVAATGVDLNVVDAAAVFLAALAGVTDPEEKRKIIGREFIRAFEQAAREIAARRAAASGQVPGPGHAVPRRGRVRRRHRRRPTSSPTTTSAACPTTWRSSWSSRCARCSRTRCAQVGAELGLPPEIVWRQPFPGPGLAIRIVGEVTAERLRIVRAADAIARQELSAAGLDRQIWQCPVVLLADVRSVGVQGDGRSYGYPVVLRPVTSEDAMTADWARLPDQVLATISTRITNEVRRDQPGRARHHQQAARHHRVGVTLAQVTGGSSVGRSS